MTAEPDLTPLVLGDPAPPGTVVLVGGGPGDPGLVTVRGLAAVQAADVVVYDRLAPTAVLAYARPDATLLDVGKAPTRHRTPQDHINALLVEHALARRRVVRLKGGDNFVFGRGGEEWQACAAAGVPVVVVPGVTSAIAVPGSVGIPVTHRNVVQGFTVVSGHVSPDDPASTLDYAGLVRSRTTLVILMGMTQLRAICERLIAEGMPPQTPAAVVANGFAPDCVVLRAPVAELADAVVAAQIGPPAVVVIGDVVALDLGAPAPS